MSAIIWEQDGKKELTIVLEDKSSASVAAEILKTKKITKVWKEDWTGGFAVRIEYEDIDSGRRG